MYVRVGLTVARYWKEVLIALLSVFTVIFVIVFAFVPGGGSGGNPSYQGAKPKVSAEVLRWEPVVTQYVKEAGMEEKWVPVLLGIMQQESQGTLADVMQSSESAGLSPGAISDPVSSIKQGVKHWQDVLSVASEKGITDLKTIIQAYNFGRGWLPWVKNNGGVYSKETATGFSRAMMAKFPGQFVCGGDSRNFRAKENACYGDFTYADKVTKNLESLEEKGGAVANPGVMADGMFKTVMDEAIKYQGWPYVWAGDDPNTGFDCSGLVMWSYRKANINIPRTAQEQYKATQRVEEKDVQPGDLVFFVGTSDHAFISHVGIVVGNGQMYNSNSKGIKYDDLSKEYWKSKIYGYGRVQ
ncbi:CHAP domain-containing protein (plasmid) [Bacillus mycoides]|uniref:bifunctional lytic transglycosylase/C40 family peptidase n=1 Tax=Bacillus mycoides TaxID=1405 RepID=UPI001C03799F|nr:bifunctional lytic transglycosylase/C40 family peptidase [Bacillus mycoides]QWI25643.1 CHAP domain-containing protein [Bacillus mycoides]